VTLELLLDRQGFHTVLNRIVASPDIKIPVSAYRTLEELINARGASGPSLEHKVALVEDGTTKRISVPERIISIVLASPAPTIVRKSELVGCDAGTVPGRHG